MRNLFIVSLAFLVLAACVSHKAGQNSRIKQGVEGQITEITGNQMPMKGAPPSQPKPFPTKVYFYEPTTLQQVTPLSAGAPIYTKVNTKLVASVITDSLGNYKVALPVGTYSVFVEHEKRFFANSFDAQQNIQLVGVTKNNITRFNIEVNARAIY